MRESKRKSCFPIACNNGMVVSFAPRGEKGEDMESEGVQMLWNYTEA